MISFPPVKMQGKRERVRDRQAWHAPGISAFGGSQCEAILVYKTSSRPACHVMRLCFKQIHTQRSRWLEKYAYIPFTQMIDSYDRKENSLRCPVTSVCLPVCSALCSWLWGVCLCLWGCDVAGTVLLLLTATSGPLRKRHHFSLGPQIA